jgi:hypothetical protein
VTPPAVDSVCPPDPRVAAFLLAETGGELVGRGDEVWLAGAGGSLGRALGAGEGGWLRINP